MATKEKPSLVLPANFHKAARKKRAQATKTLELGNTAPCVAVGEPGEPPFGLFCGVIGSAPPPPPLALDFSDRREDAPIISPKMLMTLRVNRLTCGNSEGSVGKSTIIETIIKGIEGVDQVTVIDESNNSTSCLVRVEYNKATREDKNIFSTENPQEAPKEIDLTRDAVTSCLRESGFDFKVVSSKAISSKKKRVLKPMEQLFALPCAPCPSAPKAKKEVLSCRSRLRVEGICCSAEIPFVRSLMKTLPGVRKVGVNVATKVVFVDHNPHATTAQVMANALNEVKFGATIITDGCAELAKREKVQKEDASSSLQSMMDLPASRFVESTFIIPGLATYSRERIDSCPIGRLLQQNFFKDHLRAFHLHAASRTLKIEHDPTKLGAGKVLSALLTGLNPEDWGSIELAHDGQAEGLILPVLDSDNEKETDDEAAKRTILGGLRFNVAISGVFWLLSILTHLPGGRLENFKYFGIVSVIFCMPPVMLKAWATLRRFQFDSNCMMASAAIGSFILGEYDEAASVAFLFAISDYLEGKATRRGRKALGEIVSLRPEYANVIMPNTGEVKIVPAQEIPIGSKVSVRTGDKIPADGVIVEGTSSVDESSITGESRPVPKETGDEVCSGSINVGETQLVVKTKQSVGDSTLSRLIQLVEEAQANTSETEKLVDSFARKYTPVVLAIAVLMCTLPWAFGAETGRQWMFSGLIFCVIACPCALTISTPVTYSAGLAAAAQRGIVIKGGSKLEALGNVRTVLLDKTGTITKGRFALSHLESVGNSMNRLELLEMLVVMEAPSSHPLSACLIAAAKSEGVMAPAGVSLREHTILKGEGVTALVDGAQVYCGNERLFKRIGMFDANQGYAAQVEKWGGEGGTVGFVGIDGQGIVGSFCVKDSIREEASDVVSTLISSDVDVVMLTGDGEGAARAVGLEVGLPEDSIRSNLLPEDKLHYVSNQKEENVVATASSLSGRRQLVMMVGDGVNDAPALSIADVGVAMGEGATLALEMSDVTLMDSNLNKLLFSLNLGVKVINTVKENIAITVVINLVAITLTFLGKMTLLAAIISDVGTMLIVTLNGMKLLSQRVIDSIEVGTHEPARRVLRRKGSTKKGGVVYGKPSDQDEVSCEEDQSDGTKLDPRFEIV